MEYSSVQIAFQRIENVKAVFEISFTQISIWSKSDAGLSVVKYRYLPSSSKSEILCTRYLSSTVNSLSFLQSTSTSHFCLPDGSSLLGTTQTYEDQGEFAGQTILCSKLLVNWARTFSQRMTIRFRVPGLELVLMR